MCMDCVVNAVRNKKKRGNNNQNKQTDNLF